MANHYQYLGLLARLASSVAVALPSSLVTQSGTLEAGENKLKIRVGGDQSFADNRHCNGIPFIGMGRDNEKGTYCNLAFGGNYHRVNIPQTANMAIPANWGRASPS